MIRGMIRSFVTAVFAAAGLLAGCTSSSSPPTTGPASTAAVTVTMGYHSFNPDTVTIQVGQTVNWHNDTWISHTVTCDPTKAQTAGDGSFPAAHRRSIRVTWLGTRISNTRSRFRASITTSAFRTNRTGCWGR